jgi:hypothetical protein
VADVYRASEIDMPACEPYKGYELGNWAIMF